MLSINDCSVSCGVKVIGGETQYQTAAVFVKDFLKVKNKRYPDYTQFVFTHCTNPNATNRDASVQEDGRCMGDKIEEFVKEHNLGVVTRSEPGNNPIHGYGDHAHNICVWIWTTDNKACADYLSEVTQAGLEKKNA